jgi:acetyl esterase/lipase
MRLVHFIALGFAMLPATLTAAEPITLKLWPGTAPGDENFQPPPPAAKKAPERRDDVIRIPLVTEPSITVYQPPAGRSNGAAVVVCPGGGYNILAWNLEGTEVAEWLNSFGVTAVVLQYRVPRRSRDLPHAAPLQDAQRAIRLTRKHAAEWRIDPKRVGILGFSAGGNLAVMAATRFTEQTYSKIDDADTQNARPDFMVPIYPAYLGNEDKPGPLSSLVTVTPQTPPAFLAVTHDDKLRGMNAALLYVELKRANIPAELHVFLKGGHGYGLRKSENPVSQWPKACEEWMLAQGLLAGERR